MRGHQGVVLKVDQIEGRSSSLEDARGVGIALEHVEPLAAGFVQSRPWHIHSTAGGRSLLHILCPLQSRVEGRNMYECKHKAWVQWKVFCHLHAVPSADPLRESDALRRQT